MLDALGDELKALIQSFGMMIGVYIETVHMLQEHVYFLQSIQIGDLGYYIFYIYCRSISANKKILSA